MKQERNQVNIIKRRDERDLPSNKEDEEPQYDEEYLEEIRKELADHEILNKQHYNKPIWKDYV